MSVLCKISSMATDKPYARNVKYLGQKTLSKTQKVTLNWRCRERFLILYLETSLQFLASKC